MLYLYVLSSNNTEICYNIEVSSELTDVEMITLYEILTPGLDIVLISHFPYLNILEGKGVEIGPFMNFETAFSTNVVSAPPILVTEKKKRIFLDIISN